MTSTQALPKTPGFNCHLTVRFRADRNGRPFADAWSRNCPRWVRVNRTDAELWVAQGLATKVDA